MKEAGIWLVGIVLVLIVLLGERLPLCSIGLRARHRAKTTTPLKGSQ